MSIKYIFVPSRVRRKAVKSREAMQYSMEADLTFQSIPSHCLREVRGNEPEEPEMGRLAVGRLAMSSPYQLQSGKAVLVYHH
jgi:hypothetical protein